MASLTSDLRKLLEKTIIRARAEAESAAGAALTTLAVAQDAPFAAMNEEQRQLRRLLRARARQLGGGDQTTGLPRLQQEIAYAQWHRMLFARFLAENDLLIHPQWQVAVTLTECAELAAEEGASDAWELAARYATLILPGIFPLDDAAVQVRLAPEGRHALEQLLQQLPAAIFTADDGLGWVYQFWQTQKKAEINASGRKIGAAELGPVTQLFTEDYMVRFLLENSLGAWWAARHPESPLLREWIYLRWLDETTDKETRRQGAGESDAAQSNIQHLNAKIPAAGTFPGWPDHAAALTVLDPCGGSGHFVVAAFAMLRRMRMAEEGLSAAAAGDAVIRDNLFMLEIDPRCTQIATFNLVLAAWKTGGYRPLPTPNIACSGIAVAGQLGDWLKLAGDDIRLRTALERLYMLFQQAPSLGSLINPAATAGQVELFSADYAEVAPLLEKALQRERASGDPAAAVLGVATRGVLAAVRLLVRRYTLVATNVPYLARGNQEDTLMDYCDRYYPAATSDLATAFVERCRTFTSDNGSYALVTPQNWLFLSSYTELRKQLMLTQKWNHISWLGAGAFEEISGEVVIPVLVILTDSRPTKENMITGLDVSNIKLASDKARGLLNQEVETTTQLSQLRNPDCRINLSSNEGAVLLSRYAHGVHGLA